MSEHTCQWVYRYCRDTDIVGEFPTVKSSSFLFLAALEAAATDGVAGATTETLYSEEEANSSSSDNKGAPAFFKGYST